MANWTYLKTLALTDPLGYLEKRNPKYCERYAADGDEFGYSIRRMPDGNRFSVSFSKITSKSIFAALRTFRQKDEAFSSATTPGCFHWTERCSVSQCATITTHHAEFVI